MGNQVQQQLTEKLVSPLAWKFPQAMGMVLRKMGPTDDTDTFLLIFQRKASGAGWEKKVWPSNQLPPSWERHKLRIWR